MCGFVGYFSNKKINLSPALKSIAYRGPDKKKIIYTKDWSVAFNRLSINENEIVAGSSILDINIAKFAYLNCVKNFEFFSGIPGTIGGAVKMNAGCYGSETKDILKRIS